MEISNASEVAGNSSNPTNNASSSSIRSNPTSSSTSTPKKSMFFIEKESPKTPLVIPPSGGVAGASLSTGGVGVNNSKRTSGRGGNLSEGSDPSLTSVSLESSLGGGLLDTSMVELDPHSGALRGVLGMASNSTNLPPAGDYSMLFGGTGSPIGMSQHPGSPTGRRGSPGGNDYYGGSPIRHSSERDAQWDDRYHQLREYRETHGDTNVPHAASGLGCWMSRQRKLKRLGKLPADRVSALDKLGVTWSFRSPTSKHKRNPAQSHIVTGSPTSSGSPPPSHSSSSSGVYSLPGGRVGFHHGHQTRSSITSSPNQPSSQQGNNGNITITNSTNPVVPSAANVAALMSLQIPHIGHGIEGDKSHSDPPLVPLPTGSINLPNHQQGNTPENSTSTSTVSSQNQGEGKSISVVN